MAEKKTPATLALWETFRSVPDAAMKSIQAGKLKGMTDINPVWRMKVLTERFGPIGFGWNVREVERWTNECAGETAAFVKVELRVKDGDQWSEPIEGTGGSKLCGKGFGDGINDEAWKMATTDAISVACKSLGIAADIYFSKDADFGTKYEPRMNAPRSTHPAPAPAVPAGYVPMPNDKYWKCIDAFARGQLTKDGESVFDYWKRVTNAGKDESDAFMHDVENFKIANQIQ